MYVIHIYNTYKYRYSFAKIETPIIKWKNGKINKNGNKNLELSVSKMNSPENKNILLVNYFWNKKNSFILLFITICLLLVYGLGILFTNLQYSLIPSSIKSR